MWILEGIQDNITFLLALIPVIILHELAHAVVALKLGDTTAKEDGRITLNPLKHLDVIGTLMLLVAGIGWAKPVMVNRHNLKYGRAGFALVAAAGPLTNLVLAYIFAIIAAITYRVLGSMDIVLDYLLNVIGVTLMLCVFNLLPIPPLDGSKVIALIFPENAYERWISGGWWSMLIIVALVFTGMLGRILSPIVWWMFDIMIVPVFTLIVNL